ncbi:UvrD-helicase domain-containing protein [uncultured Paludibaculum sp.]|uniref:ATP-dependent helicase n=1 Tax=uncultured Paludibaculum sp. TaxID=1765020 RepID=UPI002AAC2F43|nr:UvrD-helicase domain-containing protein [uncultured Paludibaculum sp.]
MDFLSGLNPQQREAVAHVEGPLLILAGAGSGKTRVITHRIAHLIDSEGVYGPSILAVTFTNKASGEMRERVLKLLKHLPANAGPMVATFHSFCVRLLRRDGSTLADLRRGFTTNFHIYDDDDQLSLLKQIYKKLGLDDKFMQHRAALSRISHAKNQKQSPADFYKMSADPKAAKLAVVFEHYQQGLESANALDFDDLLLEAVRLLRYDAGVRQLWNRRLQFLMIDEYQDTNRSQYELMRLLSEAHSNVAVVGDEDQSIYGWRGADIRNILDFENDYPGAKVIRLEQNYRSTKAILEAASRVVENNKARKGKTLWTDGADGDPICYLEAADGEQEALFIADTIEKIFRKERDTRVAILYRTNSQSRQIEEALRRYMRKYVVVGGFSFYQRAEVKDTLSYVKFLMNPRDNISMLRILNVPARGIGKTTSDQLERIATERGETLWEAIDTAEREHLLGGRAEAALAAFHRLIEELRDGVTRQSPDETIKQILDRTGYRKMLETDSTPESESKLGNLDELVSAAADAAERGDTLQDFLDSAALVADSDDIEEEAQVSLLTMHNAKGLEFPYVFIAGLEEGLFPHSRSRDNPEQLEEERRLCYVGMTRAMKRLYLTSARMRRKYGGSPPEPCQPSRFLEEVPKSLLEDLSPQRQPAGSIDLYGERASVREAARRNTYTGKTYNSLDHISQFFAERGVRPPAMVPQPAPPRAAGGPVPSAAVTPRPQPVQGQTTMRPAAATAKPAPKKGGLRAGMNIVHPKYGRGTVLRKEGDGEDAKLTVSFPGHGLKKLIAKFAGLSADD